ncbi:hypothetical protein [Haliscomenobacter sp.]|uniref:hypothetical protein n=1 Tax=Haliscomenobacter sp. TaxID=2717303 RepID=UPI003593A65F
MDANALSILAYFLLLIAVIYFFRRNDEVPILLTIFFLLTGLSRYYAVASGRVGWVYVAYSRIGIFNLNDKSALTALNYFFLGTAVLSITYMFFKTNIKNTQRYYFRDTNLYFKDFILQRSNLIIRLFVFFIVLNSILTKVITGIVALGNSYFFLFQLAIGGITVLMYLVYENFNFKTHFYQKLLFLGLLLYSAVLSYNPTLRFQFLSWLLAVGILITRRYLPAQKARLYLLGGFLVLLLFALAGVARQKNLSTLSFEQQVVLAYERAFEKREDANMLDGFMMVLDVYPHHLDFHYGMEHLEILLRPIPRSWWPDKPVGGYVNKLGLNNYQTYGTVGISQTLYGSFYGEGGVVGIVVFCFIYAWLFVRIGRYANRYQSDMRWVIWGLFLASLIPLLRGGDLPGIIAFIGMSYWPVFIFIYQYNQYLKRAGVA